MEIDKSKRIEWCDIAKGIGIILVIYGHCIIRVGNHGIIGMINRFIYSFHMPLFFILSGMLLKKEVQLKRYISKRVKRLLIPTYLYTIIYIVFQYIFWGIKNKPESLEEIWKALLLYRTTLISNYWFLPTLFLGEVLFLGVKKMTKHDGIVLFILYIFYMLGIISMKNIESLPFCLDEALIASGYIGVGYFFSKYQIFEKISKYLMFLIGTLWIVATILNCFILNWAMVDMWRGNYLNPILSMISGVSGTCVIIYFSKILVLNPIGKQLQKLGRITLPIYGLHYEFLLFIKEVPGGWQAVVWAFVSGTMIALVFGIVAQVKGSLLRSNNTKYFCL